MKFGWLLSNYVASLGPMIAALLLAAAPVLVWSSASSTSKGDFSTRALKLAVEPSLLLYFALVKSAFALTILIGLSNANRVSDGEFKLFASLGIAVLSFSVLYYVFYALMQCIYGAQPVALGLRMASIFAALAAGYLLWAVHQAELQTAELASGVHAEQTPVQP